MDSSCLSLRRLSTRLVLLFILAMLHIKKHPNTRFLFYKLTSRFSSSCRCVADTGGGDDHHGVPRPLPEERNRAGSAADFPLLHPPSPSRERPHSRHPRQPHQHPFPGRGWIPIYMSSLTNTRSESWKYYPRCFKRWHQNLADCCHGDTQSQWYQYINTVL